MARTFKRLYPKIYDWDNLYHAWRAARRGGKRKWPTVAAFEVDLESNLDNRNNNIGFRVASSCRWDGPTLLSIKPDSPLVNGLRPAGAGIDRRPVLSRSGELQTATPVASRFVSLGWAGQRKRALPEPVGSPDRSDRARFAAWAQGPRPDDDASNAPPRLV